MGSCSNFDEVELVGSKGKLNIHNHQANVLHLTREMSCYKNKINKNQSVILSKILRMKLKSFVTSRIRKMTA